MRLLLLSHVLPFPSTAGQHLRLRYTLEEAVRRFDVDFLTFAPEAIRKEVEAKLAAFGCRPIVLPSRTTRSNLSRLQFAAGSAAFAIATGLKRSNYVIGHVELSPERIRSAVTPTDYDAVLYEYIHAVNSVPVFRDANVPTVVDMHNILWRSREQRLSEKHAVARWIMGLSLGRYRRHEEDAWDQFDALIAINRNECDLVTARKRPGQKVFYAPMGTDLSRWPESAQVVVPPRLGYYGGLAGSHNEGAALRCHDQVMPLVWKRFPEAELWLVGSNPTDRLRALTADRRVKVTGFVDRVQDILSTMSVVLCPWSGTYGFRSRIVEVMALGVPVVATPAAVDGMELDSGRGIFLGQSDAELAEHALELLERPDEWRAQSHMARGEMERLYGLESTYGRFAAELFSWLESRQERTR